MAQNHREETHFADPKVSKQIVDTLSHSEFYKRYEQAFNNATGLPLTFRPVQTWNLALHGKNNENPFCEMLCRINKACVSCLENQQKISRLEQGPHSSTCFIGFVDSAVPVFAGKEVVGFLQTGQVSLSKLDPKKIEGILRSLKKPSQDLPQDELISAYLKTRVIPEQQYEAVLSLLEIFSQHLSSMANQIMVQSESNEPDIVKRARQFIEDHQGENLSLHDVARASNVSVFYLCKLFKKVTGVSFTNYLCRLRVEKAKTLLLNRSLRISEIGYEVGFQSLTHFNRVFKKITGESPTRYRSSLPRATIRSN